MSTRSRYLCGYARSLLADIHHRPVLDGFDRMTVRFYRTGLGVCTAGLVAMALGDVGRSLGLAMEGLALIGPWLVLAGTAMAIADMHLYDKRIRWLIGASGWIGALLMVVASGWPGRVIAHWMWHAGLGFVFVSVSGFALKEQFCFRVPLLRAVPALLALSLLPMVLHLDLIAALVLAIASMPMAGLVLAKARMPLDFDIGDKSRYQI